MNLIITNFIEKRNVFSKQASRTKSSKTPEDTMPSTSSPSGHAEISVLETREDVPQNETKQQAEIMRLKKCQTPNPPVAN